MGSNLGRKRPEGAGRKKGTLNKSTATLVELTQKLNVDPFEILLKFAAEDWKGLGYPARTKISYTNAGIEFEEYIIEPQMRVKAASDACQYLHAKRKAIEQTVDPQLIDIFKSLEGKSDEELLAIFNQPKLS